MSVVSMQTRFVDSSKSSSLASMPERDHQAAGTSIQHTQAADNNEELQIELFSHKCVRFFSIFVRFQKKKPKKNFEFPLKSTF